MNYLATKADLAALETRLIKWMAGIALSAATVAIATAAALTQRPRPASRSRSLGGASDRSS